MNPFTRRTPVESAAAILADAPPSLALQRPGTPDSLVRLVERLLQRDRTFRYQSAADVRDALRRLETAGRHAGRGPVGPAGRGRPRSVDRGHADADDRPGGQSVPAADAIPNLISLLLEAAQSIEVRRWPSTVEVERLDAYSSRVAALSGADAYVSSAAIAIEQDLLLDLQVIDVRTQQAILGQPD